MRNLTIHYKGHYWNYDNVTEIRFPDTESTMMVWDSCGKYQKTVFSSFEEQSTVKQKLEEGLINGHIFIELGEN